MSTSLVASPASRILRHPLFFAALFLALGLSVTLSFHLHERALHHLDVAWRDLDRPRAGLGLDAFRADLQARPVAGVDDNLSGLAWDADRRQLWAVVNNPEALVALDENGGTIARYPLEGFTDVEGIAYLGDDLLLLAEEREQRLVALPVPTREGPLRRGAGQTLSLSLGEAGNAGFEGLGYDLRGDRLFVVKEHSPRKLYEIRGLKGLLTGQGGDLAILDRSAWLEDKGMATDLSSVHYDDRSGHLLLLSDEARMLLELDGEGRLVNYRSLWAGFAGLSDSVPQGEGLTLDDQGRMYLVSEPNLFYRFERAP
ncbi:SdiA-regulated domain-containing protein [Stutzerimonas azotifigens]|uniref:SdiA-regulated domain-containing protein n=1 Tax=Stutzerimonas azotifigens TaxID=291995 RepID=UPI0003FA576F|nr:SdiA-regulated domain-containing protein [Stutzerimonas azotifigens]